MMEKRQTQSSDSDGYNTLISQEDFHIEDLNSYHMSNQNKLQVSLLTPGRSSRLAAAVLVLLAGLLLIVDIALGVHLSDSRLTATRLTLKDTESIGKELAKLQEQYKAAVEGTQAAWKQLDDEKNRQQQTNWEVEHQRKMTTENKELIEKLTREQGNLRTQILKITDGCIHCPPGWVMMNSVCFYFPFSDAVGLKSWQKAREFCQIYGGDLLVIDTKDKENATVNYLLIHNQEPSKGFWFGLRDSHEEGTWKWLDGSFLLEGYWRDGQPDDAHHSEDCAAVYPRENFFKAWNDLRCNAMQKWICEKAPTSMSS